MTDAKYEDAGNKAAQRIEQMYLDKGVQSASKALSDDAWLAAKNPSLKPVYDAEVTKLKSDDDKNHLLDHASLDWGMPRTDDSRKIKTDDLDFWKQPAMQDPVFNHDQLMVDGLRKQYDGLTSLWNIEHDASLLPPMHWGYGIMRSDLQRASGEFDQSRENAAFSQKVHELFLGNGQALFKDVAGSAQNMTRESLTKELQKTTLTAEQRDVVKHIVDNWNQPDVKQLFVPNTGFKHANITEKSIENAAKANGVSDRGDLPADSPLAKILADEKAEAEAKAAAEAKAIADAKSAEENRLKQEADAKAAKELAIAKAAEDARLKQESDAKAAKELADAKAAEEAAKQTKPAPDADAAKLPIDPIGVIPDFDARATRPGPDANEPKPSPDADAAKPSSDPVGVKPDFAVEASKSDPSVDAVKQSPGADQAKPAPDATAAQPSSETDASKSTPDASIAKTSPEADAAKPAADASPAKPSSDVDAAKPAVDVVKPGSDAAKPAPESQPSDADKAKAEADVKAKAEADAKAAEAAKAKADHDRVRVSRGMGYWDAAAMMLGYTDNHHSLYRRRHFINTELAPSAVDHIAKLTERLRKEHHDDIWSSKLRVGQFLEKPKQ